MTQPQLKTNIALLTDCLGDVTGGAEKQIIELAKRLPKDRYNVWIISMEAQGETSPALIQAIGCCFEIFRVKRIYGLSGLLQGWRFYHFLRRNSIHILMTYHFGSDIWGAWWAHWAKVPSIISNRRDMGYWRGPLHIWAYRLINPWVQTIVTVTESIKAMVRDTEAVPPQKIKVIYNGVEFNAKPLDSAVQKKDLGLLPRDLVIMHVANLRPVKGHAHLIQAFAKISQQHPFVKLILVGKDELNGAIQSMADALNIKDKVLFFGQRKDAAALLDAADLCVLPSLSEGMSNAILEYMSHGKAVIATKVGGNPELVKDGYNGLLVDQENAEALAQALERLIQNPQERQSMGQNGLERVRSQFSMEAMMAAYEGLFQIKVLHLVSSSGLFGAERVILNLAAHTKNAQQTVGAVHNAHNPHLEIIEEARRMGLAYAVFEASGRFDLTTIDQIKRYILEHHIDLVHTHNYKANLLGGRAARLAGKKWAATIHGWIGTDAKLKGYERMDAFVLKFADHVVCVSQNNYQNLLKKNYPAGRLSVIANGIDLRQFSPSLTAGHLREEFGLAADDFVLAIVGRLALEKGHKVLIEAMARAVEQAPRIKLLIVGEGPLEPQIKAQIKQFNVSQNIILTGLRKDMPEIYRSMDALVNASFSEGLPMTILEAMASRVPVIATKTGGVGQLIKDHVNGLLLEAGDVQALARAIGELFQNPSLRRQLADQAYQDVEREYSDTRMADDYHQMYRAAVEI